MRVTTLVFIAFLMLIAPCRAQQGCVPDALPKAVRKVKAAQEALLALKVSDDLPENNEVPPATQTLLRSFKNALVAAIDPFMRCQAGDMESTSAERELAALLKANRPESKQQDAAKNAPEVIDHVYGDDLQISVQRPENKPELLALKVGFGIPCGDDSLLLVYERQGGRWQRSLLWQSGGYKEISGAFGDFFLYTIVPRTGPASWAVAVTHGHPLVYVLL